MGIARNPAKYPQELAKEKTCPKCDKKDDYDGKKIRMIKKTVHATKFGFGPSVSHLLRATFPDLYRVVGCEACCRDDPVACLIATHKLSQK